MRRSSCSPVASPGDSEVVPFTVMRKGPASTSQCAPGRCATLTDAVPARWRSERRWRRRAQAAARTSEKLSSLPSANRSLTPALPNERRYPPSTISPLRPGRPGWSSAVPPSACPRKPQQGTSSRTNAHARERQSEQADPLALMRRKPRPHKVEPALALRGSHGRGRRSNKLGHPLDWDWHHPGIPFTLHRGLAFPRKSRPDPCRSRSSVSHREPLWRARA